MEQYGLVLIRDYLDFRRPTSENDVFDYILVPADKVKETYDIIEDHDRSREDEEGNYIDWEYDDIFKKLEAAGIEYQRLDRNNVKIYDL